jgi:anaerobic selenocysteine-containing dehydrogenase
MSLTRRSFIKQTAAATAASAAGVALPVLSAGVNKTIAAAAEADVTWSKAPCRFCGTGCGVSVRGARPDTQRAPFLDDGPRNRPDRRAFHRPRARDGRTVGPSDVGGVVGLGRPAHV